MSPEGVSVQLLTQLTVRAGHDHGDPRPVSNVPPCRGQRLDYAGIDTFEHGRHVTDHAPGPLGEGQLDRPVEVLVDLTGPTRHLKDRYLAFGARPGLQRPGLHSTPG